MMASTDHSTGECFLTTAQVLERYGFSRDTLRRLLADLRSALCLLRRLTSITSPPAPVSTPNSRSYRRQDFDPVVARGLGVAKA